MSSVATTVSAPDDLKSDQAGADEGHRSAFANTGTLLLFAVRLDRVRLSLWILGLVGTVVGAASSFPGLYPDAASRQARAEMMGSPAAIALGGPRIGADHYTFGAMLSNELLGLTAVFVGLMAILTVVRHTRSAEEVGTTELVLAGPVGRYAPTAAALAIAVGAGAVVGLLSAVGLAALGLQSVDLAGAVLFGAALTATGMIFACVAAVASQVTEHGRAASAMAGLALGAAFALRAFGDVSGTFLSWLSPIGWAQRTYAFVDDRWWPLALPLATSACLIPLATWLRSKRDLGSGLRYTRPGPAHAPPMLSNTYGLALRLERTSLGAWALSLFGFGVLYGTFLSQVNDLINEKKFAAVLDMLGTGDPVSAFLALLVMLLATASAVFGVLALQRALREEDSGRAELLLSLPVSRSRWIASHVIVSALGSTAVLAAGAFGLAMSGALSMRDADVFSQVFKGAAVQVVPVLFVLSLGLALFGWIPRFTYAVWIVVVYAVFVATLGGLLGLPSWASQISPFGAVPAVPSERFTPLPVILMLAGCSVLAGLGLAGLNRRDLRTG